MLGRIELVVLLIIPFYSDIYTQPTTKDGVKQSRQVNFQDCCPCPDIMPSMPRYNEALQAKNGNGLPNEENMRYAPSFRNIDDCPYPSRSADNEGSSSIFFPTSVRANGPSTRPLNHKEDMKNLLEPEVDFASSVLETIREATEVEYQDALARDAAKSRAVDDVIANESAPSIVTIILPNHNRENNDDSLLEPTHVHESRCIHPIGSTHSKLKTQKVIPHNLLQVISRVPNTKSTDFLNKNNLDMDNNAQSSNIQESFSQNKHSGLKLKAKSELEGKVDNGCVTDFETNLKTAQSTLLERESNRNNKENSEITGDNLQIHPTSSKPSSLLSNNNLFRIKNLLKLRDDKLISPIKNLDNPLLRQPSIFRQQLQDLTDILQNKNYLKHNNQWDSVTKHDNMLEKNGLDMKTSVLDKISTRNLSQKEKYATPENRDLHQLSNMQLIPISKTVKTEIIDSILSPSENIIITNLNDNEEKNHANLHKDALNENVDVCTNIDQGYKEIETTSDEVTQTPSDLLSIATKYIQNISVTEDKDESINPFSIENAASDDLSLIDCFEYTDDDRGNADSSSQVFENGNNPDSDIRSVVTDSRESSPGDDVKLDSFDDDSFNGVTKLISKNIPLPLTKSLTLIKEDIQKKIQELRKTPKLITHNNLATMTENNKQNKEKSAMQENVSNTDCQSATSIAQSELSKPNNPNEVEKNILETVSMEDLQKMSDLLLQRNELKQKLLNTEKPDTNSIENANLKSIDNLSSETNSEESSDSCASSTAINVLQDSRMDKNDNATIKNKYSLIDQTNSEMNSDQSENDCSIEALSSINIDKSNDQPQLNKPVNPDELTAEASDPIISALHQGPLSLFSKLKSPLLQDIIVQPSSLIRDDLNPLSDGSELDLSSLLNIPTLDEFRERLADLFGTSEINSEHEEIDCENNSPIMSSEPSEPIFHSIPHLKPLEDMDIDIFQLKPLKMGESNLLSESPRLNLKTYKAKLPIPENLHLKPMKLESTLGNSKGLLGAIFKIGPESEIKNALGSPVQKSSKIDDMTSQLRNNVETLLNSPPLNALQDFRPSSSINTFTEGLRSQTLDTIKGIQENIGKPLNVVQNGDPLNGLVKQPDALLERIADVTDDLNDKLKGLHHDFNDRFLSIRENFVDKTKLTSVNRPLFSDKKAKGNILSKLQQRNPFKTNLKGVTTDQGKKINNLLRLRNRPESEKVPQLRSSKLNGNDKTKLKTYKMPSSASVPVPKSVSVPNLKQTNTKLPSYLERTPNINTKRIPHDMVRKQTENRAAARVPSQLKKIKDEHNTNSLKDKKFKITIASTTSSPLSELKSGKHINPVLKTKKNNVQEKPEFRLGKSQTKDKQVESPIETKSVSSQLFNPRKVDSTNNRDIITKADIKKTIGSTTIKPIKDWFTQRQASKTLTSKIFEKMGGGTEPTPSLDVLSRTVSEPLKKETNPWPEITEKSFLSKVRDAIKARVSNVDLGKTIKNNENSDIIRDTDRAASETTDVVLSDTLKENVSYKCTMVCTKET